MAPDRAVPPSGSVMLTDYNAVEEILRDTELLGYLEADTVRFTVNGVALTKNQSLEFRNAPTVSVKVNYGTTSSAPTATDDRTAGYSIGSMWITTTGVIYICTSDTATAATWRNTAETLQTAYNNGNTIVTAANTPIQFSLTSGGLTVDGAGAVNIGATADAQTINVGTGAAAKAVTVGSSTGASSLNLTAGTGNTNVTTAFALTGDISPASIGANQNDYNPTGFSGANTLRLTSSAAYNITGLAGGADGRILAVYNIGTFTITLTNEDAGSTAANRFSLPNGSSTPLPPKGSALLQYDSTASRWRVISMTWDPSTVGSNMIVVYVENEANTSTTGVTFISQILLTHVVTAATAGNYMLFWDGHISNSSSSATFNARIYQDATTVVNLISSSVPSNGSEYSWMGHKRFTLAAGTRTFDMQFNHAAGSGSTSMQEAHMSLWRIS